MCQEIKEASQYTDVRSKLFVSLKANLILPTHRLLDHANEAAMGSKKIGSTLKGIGPTYTDKTARNGIRVGDLLLPDFDKKYRALRDAHLRRVESMGFDFSDVRMEGMSFADYEQAWLAAVEQLRGYQLVSTEYLVNNALADGHAVLAEGAQGTLLDVDFGTYPYVTSSICSICPSVYFSDFSFMISMFLRGFDLPMYRKNFRISGWNITISATSPTFRNWPNISESRSMWNSTTSFQRM